MMRYAAPAFLILALAGCNSGANKQQATATQIEDVEAVKGTITDDPINLDRSIDEAPLEAAPAVVKTSPDDDPQPKPVVDETEESPEPIAAEIEPAEEAE